MRYYEVQGGCPLEGSLTVQGAKNSVLPILAATLLIPGLSVIENCPRLSDVDATLEILRRLGCRVGREDDRVWVDATSPTGCTVEEQLMRQMRSSVLFLGALLGRLGQAEVSCPGGCRLGPRPIDLHLQALRCMGAALREEQGDLLARAGETMEGGTVCLPIPSVGATENAMLAACGCSGMTVILGAAREPEIVDLQNFLCAAGADVRGAGTSEIAIRGGRKLHPAGYRVMGDRMAAATLLCAAAAAGGDICLKGIRPSHLGSVLACLEQGGCRVDARPGEIRLLTAGEMRGIRPVPTAPYPGFPTDAQPPLMAALAGGRGNTMFVENVFESRYHHVDELRRMGARIQVSGRVAVVAGAGKLHAAAVHSHDLRGGAAMVIAGLSAEGITQVHGLRHIDRGYDGLDRQLRQLGAQIRERQE